MARGAGVALKSLQLFNRFIQLCCAAAILGIYSYFLATLHNHGLNIDNYTRSVEGISGAAVLYTLIGLSLLCFVAGIAFFSITAILLDLAFVGAFAYIAYQTRGGAGTCHGTVNTVYGTGDADSTNYVPDGSGGNTALPSFRQACQLETACFSLAIVAIAFFLLSALLEVALLRHHKKEKAFGPSPTNNYTAGSTSRRGHFWQRRHAKRDAALGAGALGVTAHEKHNHPDILPTHSTPADVRQSYTTDNTAVGNDVAGHNKYGNEGINEGINDGYRTPTRPASGYNGTATPTAYDGSNVGYGHHNAGLQGTGLNSRGEIPASQYANHSIHDHNNSTTF